MTSKEQSGTVSPTVDMINRHTSSVIKEISMRCFVDERHNKRPRISPQERQRAPVACTSCRLSKIRCSSSSGIPCAHCRLKGVPCIIRHGQKGKNIKQRSPDKIGTKQGNSEPAINSSMISIPTDDESSAQSVTGESASAAIGLIPRTVIAERPLDVPYEFSHVKLLPPYIKPLSARVLQEDVEYLATKGALAIPDVDLRDELLRCYIEFVPGTLPGPDWHDILAHVEQRTPDSGGLSLLLFQAVMFVATAFIDLNRLRSVGFRTRRAARQAFFKKVRLLYDFDCEDDRVCVVQSLLLMTYWVETADDQKDCWYWMGLALSTASTIGLGRDTERPDINEKERRLRRRLWWSCVMRDPIIALGTKRPAHIRQADYNIPMLTIDDFDISAVSIDESPVSVICALARDSTKQYRQTIMSIEQAKLCQIIGSILNMQYDIFDSFSGGTVTDRNSQTTVILLPTCEHDNSAFNRSEQELQSWLEHQPEEALYTPIQSRGFDEDDRGLVLLGAMNSFIYFIAVNMLHRPRSRFSSAFQLTASTHPLPSYVEASRKAIHKAVAGITCIARDLHQHGLSNLIPVTGLSAIVPAMLSHLVCLQSPDKISRDQAREAFTDCMLVVEEIGKAHPAADFTIQFLKAAAHRVMGLAVEDIEMYGRQIRPSEHIKAATLEQTLNTPGTHLVNEIQQSVIPLQCTLDQEVNYLPFYSPPSPSSTGNRDHAKFGSLGISVSDISQPREVVPNPFNNIFNFGEVGALFWFDDWVGS